MLVGITTPGFIQNWREKEEKREREGDDANEKGRDDEKGTSLGRTGVTNHQKYGGTLIDFAAK